MDLSREELARRLAEADRRILLLRRCTLELSELRRHLLEKRRSEHSVTIDAALARRLVAAQFPQWGDRDVRPVERDGWDNRSFRLGDELVVRLPSAERYAAQPEKEHHWLPQLAPRLPLAVPGPVALGEPGEGYPWRWSVRRWIDGETADVAAVADPCALAVSLAAFLHALRSIDPSGGPPPGPHNFHRGGPLATYDAESRRSIAALRGRIDGHAAAALWDAALGASWRGADVWIHGDVAASNLLVREGRLVAVIDFGGIGVGDPACDFAIAWTAFSGESRRAFRAAAGIDAAAWTRAAGWALWKALITVAALPGTDAARIDASRRVLDDLLREHVEGTLAAGA